MLSLLAVFIIFFDKCNSLEPNTETTCDANDLTCKNDALDGGWHHSKDHTMRALLHSDCDILRVDGRTLTRDKFESLKDQPLLITGLMDDWPAQSRWRKQSLISLYGHLQTPYGGASFISQYGPRDSNIQRISLETFIEERLPAGAFTFNHESGEKELPFSVKKDIRFPRVLSHLFRDSHIFFSLGSDKQGTSFHAHLADICAVVYGKKYWFFYEPENMVKEVYDNAAFLSPYTWFSHTYSNIPEEHEPLECVQNAGEIMYIPDFWHHSTMNIGETVAVGFEKHPGQKNWFNQLENTPKVPLLYSLAESTSRDDNYNLNLIKERLVLEPSNLNMKFRKIYYLQKLKRFDDMRAEILNSRLVMLGAERYFEKSLEHNNNTKRDIALHWAAAANFFLRSLNPPMAADANEWARNALEVDPENLSALIIKAFITLENEDIEPHAMYMYRANAVAPNHPNVKYLRKISFINLKDKDNNDQWKKKWKKKEEQIRKKYKKEKKSKEEESEDGKKK